MQPDVASYTDDSLSSPRLHLKGRSIRETSGSLESAKSVRNIDIQRTTCSICFHDIMVFKHLSQMFLSFKKLFFLYVFFNHQGCRKYWPNLIFNFFQIGYIGCLNIHAQCIINVNIIIIKSQNEYLFFILYYNVLMIIFKHRQLIPFYYIKQCIWWTFSRII